MKQPLVFLAGENHVKVDLVELQRQHARLLEVLDSLPDNTTEHLDGLENLVSEVIWLLNRGPVLLMTEEQYPEEDE